MWILLPAAALLCASTAAETQEPGPDTPTEEIVANLAAGRVVIAVVKDAILIGTVENPLEPGTRPPIPVAAAGERAEVFLGPVEWFSPTSRQELARLDRELPRLHSRLIASSPHLAPGAGAEAQDIESIGQGLLERLSGLAQQLHSELHVPPEQPFAELLVADYIEGYGPEVWELAYGIQQEPERGDYWSTTVPHPRYTQLWPPEKGRPQTLVEIHYPLDDSLPNVLDLLRRNDPRLGHVISGDPKSAEAAEALLNGQSGKVLAASATPFLQAALPAIAPPHARYTLAIIRLAAGFDYIVAPPPEPKKPGEQKQRPPGAPSLIKPTG